MKKQIILEGLDQGELIELIHGLQERLKKKADDLSKSRLQLSKSRNEIRRLKGIVKYQRNRIISLHKAQPVDVMQERKND